MFPSEIINMIFHYTDIITLCACKETCTIWHRKLKYPNEEELINYGQQTGIVHQWVSDDFPFLFPPAKYRIVSHRVSGYFVYEYPIPAGFTKEPVNKVCNLL